MVKTEGRRGRATEYGEKETKMKTGSEEMSAVKSDEKLVTKN